MAECMDRFTVALGSSIVGRPERRESARGVRLHSCPSAAADGATAARTL